tara:strand:- start:16 stop:192 length:177 start_codon:yes stop_codon:yes gene_type:complete
VVPDTATTLWQLVELAVVATRFLQDTAGMGLLALIILVAVELVPGQMRSVVAMAVPVS